FSPEGRRRELPGPDATRFLFVGGVVGRKGADILFDCWREAFAGRDDVILVVKDFGADGIYRAGDRGPLRKHAASGALPPIVLLDEVLSTPDLAALYRTCDVLVHPYRGEGFAMPVLEAMACGVPVIVTAGGPTDEFVPPEAGWRIDSRRVELPNDRIEHLQTRGRPWLLAPDRSHLVSLLREAEAVGDHDRRARGAIGAAAAQLLSWDAVADRYASRIAQLCERHPASAGLGAVQPFPLSGAYGTRVLATPAWRGADRLGALLAEWVAATEPGGNACLYLLADPGVDGSPEQLEARVLAAASAAGVELDAGADVDVLMEFVTTERDVRLHAAMDGYVPLHAACAGHELLARQAGSRIIQLGDGGLAKVLGAGAGLLRAA
ncbi:MAG: glycosyltransferase family 4 protein, partial [Trebonia sp.]